MEEEKRIPRLVIAGTHSGTGKTTVTMGLIAALRKRGYEVQPFKAGPDYIDPSYHSQVGDRVCHNLDSWLLNRTVILEIFNRRVKGTDLAIIEGVMGLFDGLDATDEHGSTAHLAKILEAPVILIIDGRSMSRSAAAMAYGYKNLDPHIQLAGIIVNWVASATHYQMIREAIEELVDLPVLGFIPREEGLALPERHLGLIPTHEHSLSLDYVERLAQIMEKNINLERLLEIAYSAPPLPCYRPCLYQRPAISPPELRLGVAWDQAFNFYYEENLELLRHWGVEIITFSPLQDSQIPPDIQGLYLGGGFPELFAPQLEENRGMRRAIKEAIDQGLPTYAECGGLMYLMESIEDLTGKNYEMVGALMGKAKMQKRRMALGYVEVEVLRDNLLSRRGDRYRGHEFHWSILEGTDPSIPMAYQLSKKLAPEVRHDGFIIGNLLASYTHLHFASFPRLAENFVSAMHDFQEKAIR